MCVMKIQTTKKERKQMLDNLVKDTVTGIVILAIFLIIGMISSCTTPQQATSKELQPTATHDVLIDRTTGEQFYVPRQ